MDSPQRSWIGDYKPQQKRYFYIDPAMKYLGREYKTQEQKNWERRMAGSNIKYLDTISKGNMGTGSITSTSSSQWTNTHKGWNSTPRKATQTRRAVGQGGHPEWAFIFKERV